MIKIKIYLKRMIVLITILIAILLPNKIYAYEDEFIKINVPEGYQIEDIEVENTNYILAKAIVSNSEIYQKTTVGCIKYTGQRKNLASFTKEELNAFSEGVISGASNKSYVPIIMEKKIEKIGEYDCIYVKVRYDEVTLFQEAYALLSDQYLYSIVITSEEESYFTSKECMDMKNSIKIKDNISDYPEDIIEESTAYKIGYYLAPIVVIATFVYIVYLIIKNIKNRRKDNET